MSDVRAALAAAAIKAAHEYAFCDFAELEFSDAVNAACRENVCGMYGRHWTCPPGVGTAAENREKYSRFHSVFIFTTVHEVASYGDTAAVDRSREAHRETEKVFLQILAQTPHALLGAGACNLCKACTYPDAPCRFPERAQTAVEAVGIDVLRLANRLQLRSRNGENTITWFSLLLY